MKNSTVLQICRFFGMLHCSHIIPWLYVFLRLHNIESKLDDLKHMETSILGPEQIVTRCDIDSN